jgi:regulator of PEP synthase PpsR (kinase-PPPase family)
MENSQLVQNILNSINTSLNLNNKVDKQIGMGLSSNDFTNIYKSKIDNIDYATNTDIDNLFN